MAIKVSTPGVYIEEIPTLPPSVAEVESAIPAFIGYTEKAKLLETDENDTLLNIPTKIYNLNEYVRHFGGAFPLIQTETNLPIKINEANKDGQLISLNIAIDPKPDKNFILFNSLKLYFANGGGPCYIVSVGTYKYKDSGTDKESQLNDPVSATDPTLKIVAGIEVLKDYDEPTLLVCPEAVYLTNLEYTKVIEAMITQCADQDLRDRFAIIDVRIKGNEDLISKTPMIPVDNFRGTDTLNATENINLSLDTLLRRYSAAYYPYLETSYNLNFDFDDLFITAYKVNDNTDLSKSFFKIDDSKKPVMASEAQRKAAETTFKTADDDAKANPTDATKKKAAEEAKVAIPKLANIKGSELYNRIKAEFDKLHITLPPSPAIAGVYAKTDSTRGVWKAPANVGLVNVIKPSVNISNKQQDNMNIDPTSGKSVNVIRQFPGLGNIVWGARTLDGNDNEWRYVNVRRFFITVEESIKKSINWAVFEPNTSITWVKVKGMIENYLFQKWRDGALAGAKPEEAYFVRVGLPQTMNSQDILEGRMYVEIGMAVARPAEFIILKFMHKLQTS